MRTKLLAAILVSLCVNSSLCETVKIAESTKFVPYGATGKTIEVTELKFTGTITNIIFECRLDGACIMEFEGIAVNFGPYITTNLNKKNGGGGVEWLKPFNSKEINKYVGMKAEVYCNIPPWQLGKTWRNKNGTNVKICNPHGNPKYYVRFKQ